MSRPKEAAPIVAGPKRGVNNGRSANNGLIRIRTHCCRSHTHITPRAAGPRSKGAGTHACLEASIPYGEPWPRPTAPVAPLLPAAGPTRPATMGALSVAGTVTPCSGLTSQEW